MTQENQPREIMTIQLANGAIEADAIVKSTMLSLEELLSTNLGAFYELVTRCRDGEHELSGNTKEVLMRSGLVQEPGRIPNSITNIVLSAVRDNGLAMTLGSPLLAVDQDSK